MKKLLLDSANIDEITLVSCTSAISGVTTNPSLMAKESKGDYNTRLTEIAMTLNHGAAKDKEKHLSVEVITTDPIEIEEQAVELYDMLGSRNFPRIDLHIKVPVTIENLNIITRLENRKIKVNATACMMPSQAKLAMDAGASVVSFFYNRMKDGGDNAAAETIAEFDRVRKGPQEWQAYGKSLSDYNDCKVICGSIRTPEDVTECWNHGADAVTVPMRIVELMMEHPQTDLAITRFQEDIDKWLEKE